MRDIFIKEIRQAVTIYTGDVRPKTCAPLKTDAFGVAEPPNKFDAYDAGHHNHALSDEVIKQQLLINEMKVNIRNDPSPPLRRVYDQSVVVARRHENAPPAEEIPLIHQVASQLKRTKYNNVPPVPNDDEDVEINDVWRLKMCLKKVMALGFLPLALVRFNFNRLRQSHAIRRLIQRLRTLHDFFTYFENNYVNGNFPARMWNVFKPSHGDTHKQSC